MHRLTETDQNLRPAHVFDENPISSGRLISFQQEVKDKSGNDYEDDRGGYRDEVMFDRSLFGEYGEDFSAYEAFHDVEDDGEEEKEATGYLRDEEDSSGKPSAEKMVKGPPRDAELDHVLAEIPAEVFSERDRMIGNLKECLAESPSLKRKNRLLELAIVRYLRKKQRKAVLADTRKPPKDMDKIYRRALLAYKQQLDEIMARQNQLMSEIHDYENRVQAMCEEDKRNFDQLLNREKNIAFELVYAKTGKKLPDRLVNEMTRRQVSRRNALKDIRFHYLVHQHRYEKLCDQLAFAEVLGKGMTTMDYKELRTANIEHRDKLDDRDRELEKLSSKIQHLSSQLCHLKEKEVCLIEDTKSEEELLNERKEEFLAIREDVNKIRLTQRDIRWAYNDKRVEAGLLFYKPQLYDMEITINIVNETKENVSEIREEIRLLTGYKVPDKSSRNAASPTRTSSLF
ncbi:cilia- and flagella-associated protein 184-like [Prorops nasuta]|uniref:cilia- and flagella-associated protein 184-like n=1 Tax=Prorops nasuta TaxID=863751 RepID=UPI0034CDFFFA